MTHILIVEGNSESLVSVTSTGQIRGAAERYADALTPLAEGLTFSVTRPHFEHDPAPRPDWNQIDGVVFTGSGVYWSADDDEAASARDVMATAFQKGKPVFGSCYGMQIGAAVLGCRVQANPKGAELLIARNIRQTKAGKGHRLYAGKPEQFDALCIHRDDVVEIASGLEILGENEHCAIQSVASRSGDVTFWGVQYHPELDFEDIARYVRRSDVEDFTQLSRMSACLGRDVSDTDELVEDFNLLARQPDNPALIEKYDVSHSVVSRDTHTCELSNWLRAVQDAHR